MDWKNKLKGAIQSSKVNVNRNTVDKLKNSATIKGRSFKTPKSFSEIKNFEKDINKNLLSTPDGSTLKNILKDELQSSIDNVVNEVKGSILKETGAASILKKVKKDIDLKNIITSSNSNISNNPQVKSWQNSFETKAQKLGAFVSPGAPYIEISVKIPKKLDSEEGQGNVGGKKSRTSSSNTIGALQSVLFPANAEVLKTGYSFEYEEKEKLKSLGDVAKKGGQGLKNVVKEKTGMIGEIVAQKSGVTSNPNQENFFKGVSFRSFSFNFELLPKNKQQSEEMMRIVYMLKYWSHPQLTAGGLSLEFPNLWEISYYNSEAISFRSKPCYCKSVSIEYGSSNGYLLFKENDKPTSVKIALEFTENEYITRGDLGEYQYNGGQY